LGGADLRFFRHQFTLGDHGYGASASHGVPVYVSAFVGTHCAYPQRDGQAELIWVAGYIPRSLPVCRQSPLQVLTGHWLTSLMQLTALPT